jgi:hypothetical protein
MDDQPDTATAHSSATWQMLAEFVLTDATGHDAHIVARLALTLQALALASVQQNQVQSAITDTLHHLLSQTQRFTVTTPVHIRIYCNHHAPVTNEPLPMPGLQEQPTAVGTGSWGFFLTEKWVGEEARRHYLIELYLYAERR